MYTASEYRALARRALSGFWALAIGVTLVAALLGGVSSLAPSFQITFSVDGESPVPLMYWVRRHLPEVAYLAAMLAPFAALTSMLSLAQFVVGGPVQVGYSRFCLHRLDGRQAEFSDLFSAFDIFGQAFLLHLFMALKIFAWSLLFVIPGIVAAYRYAMAPYIMAENPNLTASECIALSKQMMDGKKGKLFCLHLSFIGWAILVPFTLGIGMLWLSPYVNMAQTAFYRSVAPSVYQRQQPNEGYRQPGGGWYRTQDSDHRGPEL